VVFQIALAMKFYKARKCFTALRIHRLLCLLLQIKQAKVSSCNMHQNTLIILVDNLCM
jgi:hypothetical protein